MKSRFALTVLFVIAGIQIAASDPADYQHVFSEQNGLVVMEAESHEPGTNWAKRTGEYTLKGTNSTAGASNNACLHFTGNREMNGPVTGEMTFTITINNPGSYRVYMRAMEAPIESGAGDRANDCYVKMEGQGDCEGQFTKYVLLGASFNWSWNVRLECSHHSFSDAVYVLSAGTHSFKVAGRSKNFLFDRIVLAKSSVSNPKSLSHPESSEDCSNTDPVDPPVQTQIISPAAESKLTMGSTITLKGEGTNLTWSYDANSDKKGEIAIGSGSEVSFAVPTDVSSPLEITLTLSGDGGNVQETYQLLDSETAAMPYTPRVNVTRSSIVRIYALDGSLLAHGEACRNLFSALPQNIQHARTSYLVQLSDGTVQKIVGLNGR